MFPTLKTGAVAQYPWSATSQYSTTTVQFLDGSLQTFKLYGRALRSWSVQLSQLDEQELDQFISFVEAQGGEPFTFTDPVTGAVVPNCILAGDEAHASMQQELSGQTTFTIQEVA